VAKKMTREEFIRNNRGINGGKDLPKAYLEHLYEDITTNEIRIVSAANNHASATSKEASGNVAVLRTAYVIPYFMPHVPILCTWWKF